ncbi:exonuclease RecJ [Rubritalea squalenifaciens DSM 18772]|uniref:Single-stranded-DNA-specific exonuclease RecJ n=1 Tax=Rubritalea squalenifaciens DSM 18772 TaxID=1123071 RepID=A0A1M6L1M9_9BACT|nr:single-stranded-DNA-specific exonuclease RecJ [Rubritalea squalenifaciens]SHJ65130.1 exonuclease RecJ [Rubritalea squalenifaciens DSM 18772]
MAEEEKQWIIREDPPRAGAEMGGLPPILLKLLGQRGVEGGEAVEKFLKPRLRDLSDPYLLPDMEKAVERVLAAIDAGENILVYGDYDVDGVTSVALMCNVLRAYGVAHDYFIPKRGEEGYGLSDTAIDNLLEDKGKPDLIITVDCGTASIDEIERINSLGIDLIVVDHHEMSVRGKPECIAVVNPKLGDDFHYLCAAGVVFKLAHALLKRRMVEGFDLKEYIDMVAVATVADIVPLVEENRLLVRHGLRLLPETKHAGLLALQQVTGMNGNVSSMDVGFRIGPRLNAAGRMDKPEDALALMLEADLKEARKLAEALDLYNRERQLHEKQIRDEALAMVAERPNAQDEPVIVLGSRSWHPGVVGIVASRLMRQFYKPTFIVSVDEEGIGKGSGRSVEGISLVEAIQACPDDLIAGGGHDMAAGLSILESKIDEFRENFSKYVLENTTKAQRAPKLHIDAEIGFDELSLEFMDSYDLLQPFGSQNPQPVFMSRNVWLTEAPRHLKNKHIKLFLRQGFVEHDAIFFGGGERSLPDPPWDVAFTIDRNTFRGRTTLQMVIQDVRSAEQQSE